MNTILERIKEAYYLETDAEVAEFLGIKPSTLSMQKNRGRLNLQRIITKCSDLNKNWLLDGIGPMRQTALADEITHIPIYSSLVIANDELDFRNSKKIGNVVTDTLFGVRNFLSSDQVIGYLIQSNTVTPTLRKDDIAIIHLDSSPADNSIFLFSADEEVTFNKLKEKNGKYFVGTNGDQMPFESEKNDQDIIGKLIWIMRQV